MGLYVGTTKYKPIVGGSRASIVVPDALPYDAEVAYLQSRGAQFIDTGYAFSDGYSWEIDLEVMSSNSTAFGARASSVRTSVLYYSVTNGMVVNMAGYTGSTTPFKLGSLTSRHTIRMSVSQNKGTVWVDDEKKYDGTSFNGSYISSVSQALFATKYGDNDFRDITESKIYSVKMWQGADLVRDYIPVRVGTTGYMYDKVSGQLFGNAGTGDFILGPDVTKNYDAEIEYLQSTGTQWIDTGLNADSALFYEIKVQATTTSTQRMGALSLINSSAIRHHFSIPEKSTHLVYFGYGADALTNNLKYNTNPHTFSLIDKIAKVDGSIVTTFNDTFDCGINFYLFARNGSPVSPASARVYWCKLYNGTTLVRDYIPVRKGTTGYLYDKVSRTLFGNEGTGSFILGNDKN